MKTMKGPGIYLAQFIDDTPPFHDLKSICHWAAQLGYQAVQLPTWDKRIIDLALASQSKDYCEEIKGIVEAAGLVISELSTHLQGQLVASHPAYDAMFDAFAPERVHGQPKARAQWAAEQVKAAAQASQYLGLSEMASFSGALLFHTHYPWPQRPKGLVKAGFKALAQAWLPILNTCQALGVNVCYELHPGEDLHDGVTFERFLDAVHQHPNVKILYDSSHFVLQHLDYLQFIDYYHEYIRMFHVKDAEFNPSGKSGVYGGYQDWVDRPGRFRSLGDGQIDFKSIFSKLTQYGYGGWAVMEWECCIKSPEQGARQGADFIKAHIIEVAAKSFDDFAGAQASQQKLNQMLGMEE